MLESVISINAINCSNKNHAIIIKDYVTTITNTPWRRYKDRNGQYIDWKTERKKKKKKTYLNWYVSYKIVQTCPSLI